MLMKEVKSCGKFPKRHELLVQTKKRQKRQSTGEKSNAELATISVVSQTKSKQINKDLPSHVLSKYRSNHNNT